MANDSGDEDFKVIGDENEEKLNKYLADALAVLLEHFDSVQIVATLTSGIDDGRGTQFHTKGAGDYYSRIGALRAFTIAEDEDMRCRARAEFDALNAEPEDNDD